MQSLLISEIVGLIRRRVYADLFAIFFERGTFSSIQNELGGKKIVTKL